MDGMDLALKNAGYTEEFTTNLWLYLSWEQSRRPTSLGKLWNLKIIVDPGKRTIQHTSKTSTYEAFRAIRQV